MSNSDDDVVASSDFGSLLSEARKAQNYTADDIYRQLKIPENILTAIETNDIEALPAATYTRGYIRSYAKFLEISEDSVLALYNRAVSDEQITELKPRSALKQETNSQTPLIKLVTAFLAVAGMAAVIVGIFQYYQEKVDDIENEFDSKESSFTGNSLDSPGINRIEIKQRARLTADGELILDDPGSSKTLAGDLGIDNARAEDVAEKAVINPEKDVLEIIAEKGSWVEVRDANSARLFYNMLPEGGNTVLVGDAPFSVSLGNAETTHLIINDVEIDMSGRIRSNNTVNFKISNEEQKIIFH